MAALKACRRRRDIRLTEVKYRTGVTEKRMVAVRPMLEAGGTLKRPL